MERLQEEVLAKTEKLVGRFNVLRVIIYTVVSAVLILLILWALGVAIFEDLTISLFVFGISLAYSFFRDFFITRYSRKMMYSYYEYLKRKKPKIELYIPLFQKTRSGILLKKSALYIDKGELYLEAFNQQRSKKEPDDSISVKRGRDFVIDKVEIDKDAPKYVNYQARLMEGDVNFSVIYIKKLIDIIEKRKED